MVAGNPSIKTEDVYLKFIFLIHKLVKAKHPTNAR